MESTVSTRIIAHVVVTVPVTSSGPILNKAPVVCSKIITSFLLKIFAFVRSIPAYKRVYYRRIDY